MGLAFDFSNGTLYAANSGAGNIAEFAHHPGAGCHNRADDPDGSPGAATVSGHIDAFQAADIIGMLFRIRRRPQLRSRVHRSCDQPSPSLRPRGCDREPGGPPSVHLLSLQAGGRFRATVSGSPSYVESSPSPSTRAAPPTIGATSSSDVGQTSATVVSSINPNLAATTYVVQYGVNTSYGSNTLPGESIGEDSVDHEVSSHLTGLSPGVAYHYRVIAVNFSGTTTGPDETFTTAGRGRVTKEPVTPPVVTPIGPGIGSESQLLQRSRVGAAAAAGDGPGACRAPHPAPGGRAPSASRRRAWPSRRGGWAAMRSSVKARAGRDPNDHRGNAGPAGPASRCFSQVPRPHWVLAVSAAPASANVSHALTADYGTGNRPPSIPIRSRNRQDVEVDQTSHDIYVADSGNHRVEKFDPAGGFLLMFGKEVNRTAVENSRAAEVNVCPGSRSSR